MQWGRHLSFSHQVALSFETFHQQENIPFGMSIHLPMLWTGQRQLWLHKMTRKPKKYRKAAVADWCRFRGFFEHMQCKMHEIR